MFLSAVLERFLKPLRSESRGEGARRGDLRWSGNYARTAIVAVTLLAGLPSVEARAAATFRWSVPERLVGDGTVGAARSVGSAAEVPGTVISLRTCAPDASWSLDGDDVRPAAAGRCAFRLDLATTTRTS